MIAERVLHRLAERSSAAPRSFPLRRAVLASVLLVPHRGGDPDETALPGDYRRILQIVQAADGPVRVRAVGEELGLEAVVRVKLEPLRAKLTKLADRGWLYKRLTSGSPHAGSPHRNRRAPDGS